MAVIALVIGLVTAESFLVYFIFRLFARAGEKEEKHPSSARGFGQARR